MKSREPRTRPFQTRKRRHSQVNWSTGEKLFHAEQAIKKLKRHTEKGTCPEELSYKATARIRADNEFKNDISRIRKNAQQECVKALTRFYYRKCDRFTSELQKEKRPRVPKKSTTGTVVKKSFTKKKQEHSAPSENIVTLGDVNKLAESIQTKTSKFGEMLSTLQNMENKHVEQYRSIMWLGHRKGTKRKQSKKRLRNRKRKERKQQKNKNDLNAQWEANKKHIKNLSNQELTNDQISLLAKGLKFVPCPITKETQIRQQLLRDYENFARRMRLRYICHGEDKEPHPFHVKSTWKPPVQPSVALESYFEEVKMQLAEVKLTKPKNNLAPKEREALKTLKTNNEINLKKTDKGTTTVVLSKQDKINEGQIQLNNKDHYMPLEQPMVLETNRKVTQLINEVYCKNHTDEMTKKWLCQTPDRPQIAVFYTLTKIHKPVPTGRPIISGCEGPAEKLSAFVDKLLQPIAQQQKSYLKRYNRLH